MDGMVFEGVIFSGKMPFHFERTQMKNAQFMNVIFGGGPNFVDVNLESIVVEGGSSWKPHFARANLTNATFKNLSLEGSFLDETICIKTRFVNVNLANIGMENTDFSSAMFINCQNVTFNTVSTNLTNTIFFNCSFSKPISELEKKGVTIISSIADIFVIITNYKKLIQELSVDSATTKINSEKIAPYKKSLEMIFRLVEKLLALNDPGSLKITAEEKMELEKLLKENGITQSSLIDLSKESAADSNQVKETMTPSLEIKSSSTIENCEISDGNFKDLIVTDVTFKNVKFKNCRFDGSDLIHAKFINTSLHEHTTFNSTNMMFAVFSDLTIGEEVSVKDALILGAECYYFSGGDGLIKMANRGAILSIARLIQRTAEMFANPRIEDLINRRQFFLEVLRQIVDEEYPTLKCDPEEEQRINNLLAEFQPRPLVPAPACDFKTRNKRIRLYGANLGGVDVTDMDFSEAIFFDCNLQGAKNLHSARWQNTIFFNCAKLDRQTVNQITQSKIQAKSPLFFSSVDDLLSRMQNLEKVNATHKLHEDAYKHNVITLERLRIFIKIYLSYPTLRKNDPAATVKLTGFLQSLEQKSVQPAIQSKTIQIFQTGDFIDAFKKYKSELKTTIIPMPSFQLYFKQKHNIGITTMLSLSPGARIAGVDLSGIDMSTMKLEKVSFSNSSLKDANLSLVKAKCAEFTGVDFTTVNLTHSNFDSAYFEKVIFHGALTKKTNFCNAVFLKIDFQNVKEFHSVDLNNAILFCCTFPPNAKLNEKFITVVTSVKDLGEKVAATRRQIKETQSQLESASKFGFVLISQDQLEAQIHSLRNTEHRLMRLAQILKPYMEKHPEEFIVSDSKILDAILSSSRNDDSSAADDSSEESSFTPGL